MQLSEIPETLIKIAFWEVRGHRHGHVKIRSPVVIEVRNRGRIRVRPVTFIPTFTGAGRATPRADVELILWEGRNCAGVEVFEVFSQLGTIRGLIHDLQEILRRHNAHFIGRLKVREDRTGQLIPINALHGLLVRKFGLGRSPQKNTREYKYESE